MGSPNMGGGAKKRGNIDQYFYRSRPTPKGHPPQQDSNYPSHLPHRKSSFFLRSKRDNKGPHKFVNMRRKSLNCRTGCDFFCANLIIRLVSRVSKKGSSRSSWSHFARKRIGRRKNMRSHWCCDFLPSPLYIEVDMEKESKYVQRSGEKKEMSYRFLELLGIWGNPSPFRDVLINERWDAASAALQTHYWRRRRRRRVAFMMSAIPPISTVTTAKAGSKSHFDPSGRSKIDGSEETRPFLML